MGTPATTARATPAGRRILKGFKALIAFARDPNFDMFEIDPSPPGLDGGEPVDTVTQHNTLYRTMEAKTLITLTPHNFRAAYDPDIYNQAISLLLNQPGSITFHFPDGSTLDYFGYLQKLEPDGMTEDNMPTAGCTIVPTNTDPSDGSESPPVLTSVSGT